MKILSEDRNSELSVEKNSPFDLNTDFTVKAKFSDGKNTFYGQNDGVHFPEFAASLKQLENFFVERKEQVVIDMTEGNSLVFFRWNQKGDVGLKVKICKYMYLPDRSKTIEVLISGEMKLNSEYLNSVLADFRSL